MLIYYFLEVSLITFINTLFVNFLYLKVCCTGLRRYGGSIEYRQSRKVKREDDEGKYKRIIARLSSVTQNKKHLCRHSKWRGLKIFKGNFV